MKKLLAAVWAFLLLFTVSAPAETQSEAPASEWEYWTSRNTARLRKYTPRGDIPDILRIPDTIDGYSVTGLYSYAFEDLPDNAFSVLILPASLTEISAYSALELPASVKEVRVEEGNTVFHVTDGLLYQDTTLILVCPGDGRTVISLEEGTRNILREALAEQNSMETLILPASFDLDGETEAKLRADNPFSFYQMPKSLKSITVAQDNPVFRSVDGVLYMGDCLIRCPGGMAQTEITVQDGIRHLWNGCFYDCRQITAVHLPDSVETIREEAFYDCRNLRDIYLPAGIRTIEEGAFQYCYWLESFHLPDTNPFYEYTEDGALICRDSKVLISWVSPVQPETVTVPEGITSLGAYSLTCLFTKTVSLPDSLVRIGDDAFHSSQLTSIHIPSGVKSIGRDAFLFSDKLASVTMEDGVTQIDSFAFAFCESLEHVRLSEKLEVLDSYVFTHCEKLSEITLPDSLIQLSSGMFSDCTALKTVRLPRALKIIQSGAFEACGQLTYLSLPNTLGAIDHTAFPASLTAEVGADTYALNFCKGQGIPYIVRDSLERLTAAPWLAVESTDAATARVLADGGRVQWDIDSDCAGVTIRLAGADGREAARTLSCRVMQGKFQMAEGDLEWEIDLDGRLIIRSAKWAMTLVQAGDGHAAP